MSINKVKLKAAYQSVIDAGQDERGIYERALLKIDDSPDCLIWAASHRNKSDWIEQFGDCIE